MIPPGPVASGLDDPLVTRGTSAQGQSEVTSPRPRWRAPVVTTPSGGVTTAHLTPPTARRLPAPGLTARLPPTRRLARPRIQPRAPHTPHALARVTWHATRPTRVQGAHPPSDRWVVAIDPAHTRTGPPSPLPLVGESVATRLKTTRRGVGRGDGIAPSIRPPRRRHGCDKERDLPRPWPRDRQGGGRSPVGLLWRPSSPVSSPKPSPRARGFGR